MRIKYKILAATAFQLFILGFLLYFYVSTNSSLSGMMLKDNESKSILNKTSSFALEIKDYFNGTMTYDELENGYGVLSATVADAPDYSEILSSYDNIMKMVESSNTLSEENAATIERALWN
jgi:hypothetical protein